MDELLLFTVTSPLLHFKQTGSLLLFTLTSPPLHIRQTGSFLQFIIDEAHPSTQKKELLLFTMTSPVLHIRQTGSFLQFLLTNSPLNSDGRAPTIHSDEPFTALQTDGILLNSSTRRAPVIEMDELFQRPT